jgi:hypothetical protein
MSAYATLILNFLLSEHGLALIAWIGSALAAWIGKQIVGKYKADAIQTRGWFFAQGAVANTYQALVRSWKIQSGDGSLNDEQRAQAFAASSKILIDECRKVGIDAIKEFGPDGIRMMLERAITVSKPGSALPVAPVAVQALFPEVKP